jgi:excisionase family DNA binding protein
VDGGITPGVLALARMIAATAGTGVLGEPERSKPYLVAEIVEILRVDKATVYREIERGHLRASRIGRGRGTLRIPVDALAEYQQRTQARAPRSADDPVVA